MLPSSDAGKGLQVGSRLLLSKTPELCVLLALCLLPANFLPVAVGICPACMCLEPLAVERFWGLQEYFANRLKGQPAGCTASSSLTVSSNGGDPAVLAVIGDSNAATSVAGFSRSLELYSLN